MFASSNRVPRLTVRVPVGQIIRGYHCALLELLTCLCCAAAVAEGKDHPGVPSMELERSAGVQQRGLQLQSRVVSEGGLPTGPFTVILSIQNVASQPIDFLQVRGGEPVVWVRNEIGKLVRRTLEGSELYRPTLELPEFFSWTNCELAPGEARGFSVPFSEYFELSRPGKYTVIAAALVRARHLDRKLGDAREEITIVSKPVSFDVRSSAVGVDARESNRRVTKNAEQSNGEPPSDKEWAAIAAHAGRRIQGCVLEVIDSPLLPEHAELIVSLVCEESEDSRFGERVVRYIDKNKNEFHLLLRDSRGVPVPRTREGRELRPQTDRERYWKVLLPGDAIGAMVPVKKYFDLKETGDYWLSVSLPSHREGQPDWVAMPIKFHYQGSAPPVKRQGTE